MMQILLPGSKSSPDVPLFFIDIKNLSGSSCQRWIDLHQALGHILMYRTLADSEFLRRLPDGGIFLNDVICNIDCPFFYVSFQKNPSYMLFYIV